MAKIRFSGFNDRDAVTLSASQGSVTREPMTVSAWKRIPAASASIQISRYPANDVLPGEVVIFYVTGVSGYAGNDHDELDFEWNFGDPGATYTVARDLRYTDANREYGRVVSHAYTTQGPKTATVTVRRPDGTILAQPTVSVPVLDPDLFVWDNDLYVDFGEVSGAPDFSEAPAPGGPVQHILSFAQLDTFSAAPGESTRMTFKRGETFTWTDAQISALGRSYITSRDSFGTDAKPICVAGGVRRSKSGNPREQSMFNPGDAGNQSHIAIYGVDFDGTYDPVTGTHGSGGWACAVNTNFNTSGDFYRSFFRCAGRGMRQFYGSEGTFRNNDPLKTCYLGLCDVDISDWSNYGLSQFGIRSRVGITGTSIRQNPLALLRDDKENGLEQAADHGPIRISVNDYCGITNCNLASANGWSNLGQDNAIQPCVRLLVTYNEDDGIYDLYNFVTCNFQRNTGIGSAMLNIGANINRSQVGYVPRAGAVIQRNIFTKTRQHNGAVYTATVGGLSYKNNVTYYANVYSAANRGAQFLALGDVENYIIESGMLTDPVIVAFNTIVSDMSAASGDDSDVVLVNPKDFRGVAPTIAHNLIEAPNQATPVTTYAPLDRSTNFQPAANSTAIDAVTAGPIPLRDFEGNLRSLPTHIGAHGNASATATPVPAPVNTAPPIVSPLPAFPDEYHASSFGSWNNWGGENFYTVEWFWRVDGVPVSNNYLTQYAAGAGQTGSLTLEITVTNRSGQRVSAVSAGVSL